MTVRNISWLIILLIWVASCIETSEPREEIRLGFIAPLSQSQPSSQGAMLAADEINAAGGVRLNGGRAFLRVLSEDSEVRPETAVSKALKLINRENVVAIIGLPLSTNAIPVAALAEQHRIPLITTMSTHPDTTRGKHFVFRLACLDSDQAHALANFAFDDLAARRAAVLVNVARAYSDHLAQVFAEAFVQRGGEVVAHEAFTDEDSYFTEALLRIRSSRADLLFMPNHPDLAVPHMRLARSLGIEAHFLGGDSWSLLNASYTPLPRAYYSDIWSPDINSPMTASFLSQFKASFNIHPTTSAAISYDAVKLVVEAIQISGSVQSEALRQAIAELDPFNGVTGKVRFEGSGDPARTLYIRRIETDGTTLLHKLIQPEEPP